MLRSLWWSVAVVLGAGVIAALTTPSPSGTTVVEQGLLVVPAGEGGPEAVGGPDVGRPMPADPGAAAGTASTAAAPAAPAPSAAASMTKPARPAGTAPATTAAPPAAAPRVQPVAGSYPLSITGTSSVNGTPATVPTSGSLVVDQRGGDQQHRMVGVPGGLVLLQRANAAGVDLVSFSLSAGSKTLTFRPPSPVAFVRTDPGASWSWSVRSTDGSVTVNQTATVTGSGSVTAAGTSVPAVTVQRTFTAPATTRPTTAPTTTRPTTPTTRPPAVTAPTDPLALTDWLLQSILQPVRR